MEEVVPWDGFLKSDIPFCCSLLSGHEMICAPPPPPPHPLDAMLVCLALSPKQGMQLPWIKITKTVSRNKPSFLFFLSKIFLAEEKNKTKTPQTQPDDNKSQQQNLTCLQWSLCSIRNTTPTIKNIGSLLILQIKQTRVVHGQNQVRTSSVLIGGQVFAFENHRWFT